MGLEGAQEIGGAVVKIMGDTSDLRAKHAEAKAITSEIAKLQPKVGGGAFTASSINGGFSGTIGANPVNQGGFAAMGSAAGSRGTIDPNAVNYAHGFQAIQGKAAWAGVQSAQGDISARAGLDQKLLSNRLAAAKELGEKEGAAEAEANLTAYNRTLRRMGDHAGAPGKGGHAAGGHGGGEAEGVNWREFNPFKPRFLERAVGSAIAGFALVEGLKTVGGFARGMSQMRSTSLGEQFAGRSKILETAQEIPFVGQVISSTDQLQASGLAPHFLARYGGKNTLSEANESVRQVIETQKSAAESAIINKWTTKSALAMLTGNEIGAAEFGAEGNVRAARLEVLKGGGGEAVQNLARQQQIKEIQVKNAEQHRLMSDASSLFGMASAGSQLMAINLLGSGQGEQGAVAMTRARRLALQGQQADRMGGATNDRDRTRIGMMNKAELTLFDAQADLDAQERKKGKAIDAETAIASKREAGLRLAKRGYEADLVAFDAATKAKIDSIDDLEAKQNEGTRRAAQRTVLVQQQQEQMKASRASLASAGDVALLRAGHHNQAADLKAFDDETYRMLHDKNRDASLDQDTRDSRAKQRTALVTQQREETVNGAASNQARIGSANAAGAGMGQLASTIGAIKDMKQELRGAQDDVNRPGLIAAQEAELRGMQQQILAPRRFATEFDPTREATGGPGGDAAKETNAILRIISDYLKALVDKGPAAAAG